MVAGFKAVLLVIIIIEKMQCCRTVMITLSYRDFEMLCCQGTHSNEVRM